MSSAAPISFSTFQEEQKSQEPESIKGRFVNLSDPKVLRSYLPNEEYLREAAALVKTVYETPLRSIAGTSTNGYAFAIHPEILADAMQSIPGKTVLEIAGARGENALLLALAGAEHVYMNELDVTEAVNFEFLKRKLPGKVQKRATLIHEDCLKLTETHRELLNKIDLVLCRNLIHFFNDKQQEAFALLLKKVMKVGGSAIITTNGIYLYPQFRKTFEDHPNTSSFALSHCILDDCSSGSSSQTVLCSTLEPCESADISISFERSYLQKKEQSTNWKWEVYHDEYEKLAPSLKEKVKAAVKGAKKEIREITDGTVRILTNKFRLYSPQTLPAYFRSQGFDVESTFILGKKGHLVEEKDPYTNGAYVGVIVKAPSSKLA